MEAEPLITGHIEYTFLPTSLLITVLKASSPRNLGEKKAMKMSITCLHWHKNVTFSAFCGSFMLTMPREENGRRELHHDMVGWPVNIWKTDSYKPSWKWLP